MKVIHKNFLPQAIPNIRYIILLMYMHVCSQKMDNTLHLQTQCSMGVIPPEQVTQLHFVFFSRHLQHAAYKVAIGVT